jgi:hypothetical protein
LRVECLDGLDVLLAKPDLRTEADVRPALFFLESVSGGPGYLEQVRQFFDGE